MKDLNRSLASYGLKQGSKVMMLASKSQGAETVGKSLISETEVMVRQLREIKRKLEEDVAGKVEDLRDLLSDQSSTWKLLNTRQLEVSELLLQGLLKVDKFVVDDDVVRTERKNVVRYVQGTFPL
jgi:hypothetical protein